MQVQVHGPCTNTTAHGPRPTPEMGLRRLLITYCWVLYMKRAEGQTNKLGWRAGAAGA